MLYPPMSQLAVWSRLAAPLGWARAQLVEHQNRHLQRLVSHAYDRVPYYQQLFDRHGVKPHHIRSVSDLVAIPVTSKSDLQHLPADQVVARGVDPRRLVVQTTSGSTGEPTVIRRTWLEERLLQAFRRRALRSYGWRAGDRTAVVQLARPAHPRDPQVLQRVLQAFGLYRRKVIDCRGSERSILDSLGEFRPDVLSGYAGALWQLAEAVLDRGLTAPGVRFLVSGAEVLTPWMRSRIVEAFRAPLYDTYGCHECNLIAWECERTGQLHLCEDLAVCEILSGDAPAGEGEAGDIVVTNLHSFAMPFIRFRLGDIVRRGRETCPCGQPFGTILEVQGRKLDLFPLPDGRSLNPYEIALKLGHDKTPWVRRHQLVQERIDRIVLKVVPAAAVPPEEVARIESEVKAALGGGVEFELLTVARIDPEPNGKFRAARSLVRSVYDRNDREQPQQGLAGGT